MPLIRRLPKRGFNNAAFHKRYGIVNLDDLNAFKAGTVVNEQLLRDSNLVRGKVTGIKVLGNGELKHGLTIEADKVSAGAREKIEKAGGAVTLRDRQKENADRSQEQRPTAVTPAPRAKKRSTGKPAAKAKSANRKTSRKS